MATAKQELTDLRVQGPHDTISLEQAWQRLGCTRREVTRFLGEHKVSYLRVGDKIAIDAAGFEAAMAGRSEARPAGSGPYKAIGVELARRTRSAQGLPAKISDPSVIAKVVSLVRSRDED